VRSSTNSPRSTRTVASTPSFRERWRNSSWRATPSRDELGLAGSVAAKPIQAAVASALSFSTGAALPTVAALVSPRETLIAAVAAATLVLLAGLGALGAWLGGAGAIRPAIRVGFWGAMAMAVTAGIGALVGKAV